MIGCGFTAKALEDLSNDHNLCTLELIFFPNGAGDKAFDSTFNVLCTMFMRKSAVRASLIKLHRLEDFQVTLRHPEKRKLWDKAATGLKNERLVSTRKCYEAFKRIMTSRELVECKGEIDKPGADAKGTPWIESYVD